MSDKKPDPRSEALKRAAGLTKQSAKAVGDVPKNFSNYIKQQDKNWHDPVKSAESRQQYRDAGPALSWLGLRGKAATAAGAAEDKKTLANAKKNGK